MLSPPSAASVPSPPSQLLSSLPWSSQPSSLASPPLPRFPQPLFSLSFLLCPPNHSHSSSSSSFPRCSSCAEVALDDLQPPLLGIPNPKFKIQDPGKPREGEKVLLLPTFLRTRLDLPIKPYMAEQSRSGCGIATKAAEMPSAIP